MSGTHSLPASPQGDRRLYAIDWLRVLAVLVVFCAHVAHIFDLDFEGSMRNAESSLAAGIFMFFTYHWLMAILFLLAGISGWFSLRRRSAAPYLRERTQRLLVPLLFGTMFLIPWNGYMSALNRGTFDGSFWSYIPVHFVRTWESLLMPKVHHGLVALYHISWHLWFLGYLFLFSALAVLWTDRVKDTSRLAAFAERPLGLLTFGVPGVLVRLALHAGFPAYHDWSDTLLYLTMFFYGWLFMTDARFLRAVERQTFLWLAVGSVTFASLLGTHAAGYLPGWMAHPAYTADYLLYQLLSAVCTWAWTLALLGCGLRWLNVDSAALRYAGEAVLPFYMLHQIMIFTFAVPIVTWSTGVGMKIVAISTTAFVATMLICELLIRRIALLRLLFGLRVRSVPSRQATWPAAEGTRAGSPASSSR